LLRPGAKTRAGALLDFAQLTNTKAMGFVLGYGARLLRTVRHPNRLVAFWTFVALKFGRLRSPPIVVSVIFPARDARQHSRQRVRAQVGRHRAISP
jgi:hypothetical protein